MRPAGWTGRAHRGSGATQGPAFEQPVLAREMGQGDLVLDAEFLERSLTALWRTPADDPRD